MRPDHLIRVFKVGISRLARQEPPRPDFYLGATVSTAVAVPPDGELTAKSQCQHLRAVEHLSLLSVYHGIAILVVEPVMGRDLIEILTHRANRDAVSPHERSVSPPESTA